MIFGEASELLSDVALADPGGHQGVVQDLLGLLGSVIRVEAALLPDRTPTGVEGDAQSGVSPRDHQGVKDGADTSREIIGVLGDGADLGRCLKEPDELNALVGRDRVPGECFRELVIRPSFRVDGVVDHIADQGHPDEMGEEESREGRRPSRDR